MTDRGTRMISSAIILGSGVIAWGVAHNEVNLLAAIVAIIAGSILFSRSYRAPEREREACPTPPPE